MIAPDWFLRELHAFDPDLRVRWSPRVELFQLERRVRRSLHPGTIHSDGWHDDQIRARDGYVHVASIPPRGFGRHIFERLRAADLWANGGWKRVADELDALEAAHEEERDRKLSQDLSEISREIYDLVKHRDGRSIYSAGWVS